MYHFYKAIFTRIDEVHKYSPFKLGKVGACSACMHPNPTHEGQTAEGDSGNMKRFGGTLNVEFYIKEEQPVLL